VKNEKLLLRNIIVLSSLLVYACSCGVSCVIYLELIFSSFFRLNSLTVGPLFNFFGQYVQSCVSAFCNSFFNLTWLFHQKYLFRSVHSSVRDLLYYFNRSKIIVSCKIE